MSNGIFCVESLWNSNNAGSQRTSVAPLLEFIGRSWGVRHTTFDCGTLAELELRLKKSRKAGYNILYFSGHGEKGKFLIDDGEVTLSQLADMMGDRFYGWYIHFGSCSILNVNLKEIKKFKRDVGAYRISGYRKPVDWSASAALDLAWLSHIVEEKKFDWELYGHLIKHLGFAIL